jgi:hypothetical protein
MNASVLDDISLAHAPIIDAAGRIVATRITVWRSRGKAICARSLMACLERALAKAPLGIWLNIPDEVLLRAVIEQARLPARATLEVPAFMLAETDVVGCLARMSCGSRRIAAFGPLTSNLQPSDLRFLGASVLDGPVERSIGSLLGRRMAHRLPVVIAGVEGLNDLRRHFTAGARAVTGWPLADAPRLAVDGDLVSGLRMLGRYSRGESSHRESETLSGWGGDRFSGEPLGRRLIACMQAVTDVLSPAAQEPTLVQEPRAKVGRWLPVLASNCLDRDVRLLLDAAFTRAQVMERLCAGPPLLRDQMFLCGALSLLDRVFGREFGRLLELVPVSMVVHDALVFAKGPLAPYLLLARALERTDASGIRRAAEECFVSPRRLNQIVLDLLASTRHAPSIDGFPLKASVL